MIKQNYIETLGIDHCREILKKAPSWAKYWITGNQYHSHVLSFPNMTDRLKVDLVDLHSQVLFFDLNKK